MSLVLEDPRSFFTTQVDGALKRTGFQPSPPSRGYLIDLLQRYVFSSNLFSDKKDTLAEMWLRAQNAAPGPRGEMLKKLGDSSLYISGFFPDSFARKIIDVDYYVDMGGVAYAALASTSTDETNSRLFGEYSAHFGDFVDVLTVISQEALVQTNGDLLKLYDRYMATGSRLAEEQLAERGLINADLKKGTLKKM